MPSIPLSLSNEASPAVQSDSSSTPELSEHSRNVVSHSAGIPTLQESRPLTMMVSDTGSTGNRDPPVAQSTSLPLTRGDILAIVRAVLEHLPTTQPSSSIGTDSNNSRTTSERPTGQYNVYIYLCSCDVCVMRVCTCGLFVSLP